jgi:peptidoglycan-N-acetylglucosamine deacetylase
MPTVFVTTSWDDDDGSGLRVADLLSRYGLTGTFYVPTARLGRDPFLTADDLRSLAAAGFEIGGHTVSHAILPGLSAEELAREIGECKTVLEQILGTEITMFCYPKGRFNPDVVCAVQRAGYRGARGTQMLASSKAFDRFAIPTTLQAYPHRRSNYARNLVRLGAVRGLLAAIPELIRFENWLQLGKSTFDRVLRRGGVWHLYGHSWEIEKLGLWAQLDEMLAYVSNRSGVQYVTNGQLLGLMRGDVPNEAGTPAETHTQSVIH